jgi:hypothetical protein
VGAAQPMGPGPARNWDPPSPACNRSYLLALLRGGIIALVLLGILALIVLT